MKYNFTVIETEIAMTRLSNNLATLGWGLSIYPTLLSSRPPQTPLCMFVHQHLKTDEDSNSDSHRPTQWCPCTEHKWYRWVKVSPEHNILIRSYSVLPSQYLFLHMTQTHHCLSYLNDFWGKKEKKLIPRSGWLSLAMLPPLLSSLPIDRSISWRRWEQKHKHFKSSH